MNVHVQQSLLPKIKAISLGIFAAVSLSAVTPCCPPTACPRVDIELCPASFCIKEEVVRAAAGLGCGRIITQCDLPLVITCPGKYSVAQDLYWKPTGPGQAAITVDANDVIIEFNNRKLQQTDPTQGQCIGVLINPNLTNIRLLNGTIENVSMWGIEALSGDHELLFDSMNTFSCGYNGNDPSVQSSGGMTLLDPASFFIAFGIPTTLTPNVLYDVEVRNCNFNDSFSNLTTGGYEGASGFQAFGVQQLVIQDSNFNSNITTGDLSISPDVHGLITIAVQGLLIERSSFNGNIGFGNASNTPIFIFACSEVQIIDCQVLDNILSARNSLMSGIAIFANDIVLKNCLVQNASINAPGGEAVGIELFNCNNAVVEGCVVQNISNINNGNDTYGFDVFGSNILFKDCIAQNLTHSGVNSVVAGFEAESAFGIPAKQIIFSNCQAQSISNLSTFTTNFVSYAAGFQTRLFSRSAPVNSNIIFDSCIAQNVIFPAFPELGIGFEANTTTNLEIVNCTSIGNGVGYSLDVGVTGTPVTVSSVANNKALNNTVYGFNDQSTIGNNVLYGNYAYNPGSTGGNYNGNDAGEFGLHLGTPIRTWSFIAGQQPDATTDAGNPVSNLDNINVV